MQLESLFKPYLIQTSNSELTIFPPIFTEWLQKSFDLSNIDKSQC